MSDNSKDLTNTIHTILKGKKPVEHAKQHIDAANKKIANPDDMHKSYDISGDLDKDKPLSVPGVKLDSDNDKDDLEYVKHKMGVDDPKEKHKDDEESDVSEKDPTSADRQVSPGESVPSKRPSFAEYSKNDEIRRNHLRAAKIQKVYKVGG